MIKQIARWILKEEYDYFKNTITNLFGEVSYLQEKIEENNSSDYLIKKYPSKPIYYLGRSLPNSNKMIKIPVQVLVTPEDPKIIQDLKDWGFYETTEKPETLAPKIYKKIFENYYRYDFDKNVWGLNELWEFPFELFAKYTKKKISADCDSFAILQCSYYRAAGIPAGYVWVVAGDSQLGGHCSVYIYSEEDGKFHHLNSTYGTLFDEVREYPTHEEAKDKDKIGIFNVWLSFNDKVARSEFDTKKIGDILVDDKGV